MALPTVHEMAAAIFTFAAEQYLNSASTHQIKAALKKASELFTTLRKEDEPEEKLLTSKDPFYGIPAIKEPITLFKDCAYNALKEELTKEETITKNDIALPNVSYETPIIEPIFKDENKIYGPAVEVKKSRKPRSDKGIKRPKSANNAQGK